MHGRVARATIQVARAAAVLVYVVLMVYVTILSIAFVLRLVGVDPDRGFADWIYHASDRIMEPFRGIYRPSPATGKAAFEPSLLFAMVIYSMAGALLGALADWLSDRLSDEGSHKTSPPPPPPSTSVTSREPAGAPPYPGEVEHATVGAGRSDP